MNEAAYARSTDPATAHQAAASVKPDLPRLEAAVLDCLRAFGARGLTSEELADAMAMERVTVSPRLKPLALKGLAVDTGMRRQGRSGRASIVWRAAE